MPKTEKSQGEYSILGILTKTILWLGLGIGRPPQKSADQLVVLMYEVERLKSENTILRR